MRFRPIHKRSTKSLTDKNCNMLDLASAVARASKDGVFLMSERSDEGGFESSDNGIDVTTSICHLSKVETALKGIDAARGIIASPEREKSVESPENGSQA